MRVSQKKINSILGRQIKKTFCQTISDIRDPKEAEAFANNFLTPAEYETFSKRLAIAYWLKKGRSYENIKKNIQVSSATIASVQTMMKSKGFKLALEKVEAEEWAGKWAEKIKKFVRK